MDFTSTRSNSPARVVGSHSQPQPMQAKSLYSWPHIQASSILVWPFSAKIWLRKKPQSASMTPPMPLPILPPRVRNTFAVNVFRRSHALAVFSTMALTALAWSVGEGTGGVGAVPACTAVGGVAAAFVGIGDDETRRGSDDRFTFVVQVWSGCRSVVCNVYRSRFLRGLAACRQRRG